MGQPNLENLSVYCDYCNLHLMFYAGKKSFIPVKAIYKCSRCEREKHFVLLNNLVKEVPNNNDFFRPTYSGAANNSIPQHQTRNTPASSHIGRYIVFGLIGFAIVLFLLKEERHCAIVYSPSTGKVGKASRAKSRTEAIETAKNRCGHHDCANGRSTLNGCLALAKSPNGSVSAEAKTRTDAEVQALEQCRSRQWKKCELMASVCSD